MEKQKNDTTIYSEGYIAGYNQCKVDKKEMPQEEADRILRNCRIECPERIK